MHNRITTSRQRPWRGGTYQLTMDLATNIKSMSKQQIIIAKHLMSRRLIDHMGQPLAELPKRRLIPRRTTTGRTKMSTSITTLPWPSLVEEDTCPRARSPSGAERNERTAPRAIRWSEARSTPASCLTIRYYAAWRRQSRARRRKPATTTITIAHWAMWRCL